MQIVLLNFSDGPRSLVDRRNRTINVAVGEMRRADIHETHYRLLKHGTFLALPEEVEIPPRALDAVQLMGAVSSTPYDELLQRFWDLAGANPNQLRPTREVIRLQLRDIAQNALAGVGVGRPVQPAKRVTIHEEGDEQTRQPEPSDNDKVEDETQNPPSQPQPPRQTQRSGTRPRQHVRTRARA